MSTESITADTFDADMAELRQLARRVYHNVALESVHDLRACGAIPIPDDTATVAPDFHDYGFLSEPWKRTHWPHDFAVDRLIAWRNQRQPAS